MNTTTKRPANLLDLDYRAEAQRLGPPATGIVDVHSHINGPRASLIYKEVAELYGIEQVYSMTHLEDVPTVRENLGDAVRFIAVPKWNAPDRRGAFTTDWLERIEQFGVQGCRICKFWSAPRSRDFAREMGDPSLFSLDGKWVERAIEVAQAQGMMFMTHIGDPDTWFQTKYADASLYGQKIDQYAALERALERTRPTPWIAAHMGGWPEDLTFLDGLLSRHDHLYLDTSATKWMAREISKHEPGAVRTFLDRWGGRILFGSDVVTTDEHLSDAHRALGMGHLATSEEEAFELYASRYWVLRTLWESDYEGPSPIADPDLAMVDPARNDAYSSPRLRGMGLERNGLTMLYSGAAKALLDRWHSDHP